MSKTHNKKKTVIIAAAVLLAAGLISYFGIALYEKSTAPTSPYLDNVFKPSQFALIEDDEPDIFEREDYLALDRLLYIKRGGEEIAYPDKESAENDAAAQFFLEYFDALEKGDTEKYNAMLADEYLDKYEPQEEFTQQMVYDIHAELLSESDSDGASVYAYIVSYKIARNNGTFRRDITSDASRPVLVILKGNESLKITDISYVK